MKRMDEGRPSLVEFMGSIKFSRGRTTSTEANGSLDQFARLRPATCRERSGEDDKLIRSDN